jgi:DNA-binding MarR family transcriptional regulator
MDTNSIHEYLERLSNLTRSEIRRAGAKYDLQPIQIEALHYLAMCNRYSDTLTGVTEYLGQTKGTISQSLKVLERNGYLKRHPDKKDKRTTHLRVTKAGKKILMELIPSPILRNAGGHLNRQTQTQLISNLRALLMAVQQANGMKSFGVCHSCRHNQRAKDGGVFCALTQEPLSEADVQLICREHDLAA